MHGFVCVLRPPAGRNSMGLVLRRSDVGVDASKVAFQPRVQPDKKVSRLRAGKVRACHVCISMAWECQLAAVGSKRLAFVAAVCSFQNGSVAKKMLKRVKLPLKRRSQAVEVPNILEAPVEAPCKR